MDGVAATRAIVAAKLPVRVLILTTFDLDEYVVGALRAGASGFLAKDVPAEDLVAAIRTVAAGEAVVAPRILRRLLDRFAAALPDPDARPRRRWRCSPTGSGRCWCTSPAASPTPRSPRRCRSARPRSRPTSGTC